MSTSFETRLQTFRRLLHNSLGSFEATHEDIIRWKTEGREDILSCLSIDASDPHDLRGLFTTRSCPFLNKDKLGKLYSCAIHDTSPSTANTTQMMASVEREDLIET